MKQWQKRANGGDRERKAVRAGSGLISGYKFGCASDMKSIKKENASTKCALCSKSIGTTGIMATNPRTGKNDIMHQACWKKEMDKARKKIQGYEE